MSAHDLPGAGDRFDFDEDPEPARAPLDSGEPSESGRTITDLDAECIAFVDGALDARSAADFAARMKDSVELARRVERARVLRSLVSGLRRRPAPAIVRQYTARLASNRLASDRADVLGDATSALPVDRMLALLPRRSAPTGLLDNVLAGVRTERARIELADRRRSYRPSLAHVARAAIAAAALFAVTFSLFDSRITRPVPPANSIGRTHRLSFDLAGLRSDLGRAAALRATSTFPPEFGPADPSSQSNPSGSGGGR